MPGSLGRWTSAANKQLDRRTCLRTGLSSTRSGQRHAEECPIFTRLTFDELCQPRLAGGILAHHAHHRSRADDQQLADGPVACLLMPPSRPLPPELWGSGVSLSHAANGRPEQNIDAPGTAAAITNAIIGPMPGIVASRRLVSSARCQARICASSRSTSLSTIAAEHRWYAAPAAHVPAASPNPMKDLNQRRDAAGPSLDTMPYSASCARKALINPVRCRTRISHVLWSISTACWPTLLTATNLIVRRVAASKIASASAASVATRFT